MISSWAWQAARLAETQMELPQRVLGPIALDSNSNTTQTAKKKRAMNKHKTSM